MPKAAAITSTENPLLKDLRLGVRRGGPTGQGWWIAETFHLLEEALQSGAAVKAVLTAESSLARAESLLASSPRVKLYVLPDGLLKNVSATENSQGVVALVEPPAWLPTALFGGTPLVVVLDGLQDPGNAGAIARAAEAFGATGLIFLKGTVRASNPKAVRSSAGSLFRVPFVEGVPPAGAARLLADNRVPALAAMPAGSGPGLRSPGEIDLAGPVAFVIGSEARGVGELWRGSGNGVSIPTRGVESLNAALAAGILLYEAHRRRCGRP